jgi:hypothetical protein
MKRTVETDHLVFTMQEHSASGKTMVFTVHNKGKIWLGTVLWRAVWRKYIFRPAGGLTLDFDDTCLRDIQNFIATLTMNHKRHRG